MKQSSSLKKKNTLEISKANYHMKRYTVLDVSRYLLVSFAAQSLWGHIMTQLIVKEYHSSCGQKGKAEMRRAGFQYLFQDHVLHDGLETSHQDLPLQCPTASLGHHAEDGASNTDAEGMKIPAIATRFPASRDAKSGCGGNTAASTSSHYATSEQKEKPREQEKNKPGIRYGNIFHLFVTK